MNDFFGLSVPEGELTLMLLNVYSTVAVKTHFLTAVFDPVGVVYDRSSNIDAIIITHEHVDHFDEQLVIELQKKTGAAVLATPFIAHKLKVLGGDAEGLTIGDCANINGVSFHAEYSDHPANQPLSFVIETDAAIIYHPDDSRPCPEMAFIGDKYKPDVVLYTGTPVGDVLDIARMVKPRVIVAYDDQRFRNMEIPEVEIKALKPFEIYRYP